MLRQVGTKTRSEGVSMISKEKEIRELRGISQSKAAALADVAPNTYRVWEANPAAVGPRVRAKCEALIEKLSKNSEAA